MQEGVWYVQTLEGRMEIAENDYVIQGVKGEIYPCKPDIFEMTYGAAEKSTIKVFVLYDPDYYAGGSGTIYGVFDTKEEAEKHRSKIGFFGYDKEIHEYTLNEYDGDSDIVY